MAATIQNIELPKKPRARDTSGNNNHGEIYSGRGLEFDGVSDHLTASYTIPSDIYTVALWAKFDSTGTIYLFDNRDGGNTDGIAIYSQANSNDLRLTIYHSTSSVIVTDYDLRLDTWYRIVLVKTGADFTLYCNGVEWASDGGNDNSSNGATITLGARYSLSSFFPGKMSNVQIWDAAFTQTDVTYDYLNPESLALNASGSALTEGNLKLWYPMQDGHRGQQSYILDGANTGLGVEEVTNGGFDTDLSGWTLIGGSGDNNVTWVDGKARILYDDAISTSALGISQSSVTAGVNYKITFDIVVADGTLGKLKFYNNATETSTNLGTGSHTVYFTALGSYIKFYRNSSSVDTDLTIDNISIKAINDKHHATTVFTGDEMIADAKNRTGFGSSDWAAHNIAGGNVTVVSDKLQVVTETDAVPEGVKLGPTKFTDLVAGRTYRVSVDLQQTGGSITPSMLIQLGSTDTSTFAISASSVTYTKDIVATDDDNLIIYSNSSSSSTTFTVDNVSIKEVGVASGWTDADQQLHIPQTALQSYNELAWFDGVADHAVVSDHNDLSFDPMSISAWINMNDATDFPIIGKGAYNNNAEYQLKVQSDDKIHFWVADESVDSCHIGRATPTVTTQEKKWIHVVGTYSGGTASSGLKIYINGVQSDDANDESAAASFEAMENLAEDVYIGRYSNTYANGCITETSLWDKELSSTEVLELFNDGKALDALTHSASSDIKGYWRNNGLSTWTDLKGSNNGTPTSVTETILIPEGVDTTRDSQGFLMNKKRSTGSLNMTKKFGAASFEVDGYVDLGSTRTVADGDAFSLCVWLKPDDLDSNNYFIGGGSVDWIKIQSSTTILVGATSGSETFTINAIAAKEWVHVAIVKKADDVGNIYINGDVSSSTIDFDDKAFDYRYLGARQTDAYTFRGQVDGMLIYNKALDETEVTKNYKATKNSHRN